MSRFAPASKRSENPGLLLQRKCSCSSPGSCGGSCEKKEQEVRRMATGHVHGQPAPRIVHDVLGSPGRSLDAAARALLEPRFGHDFSGVRVHTDDRAASSAAAVNALAYTVGKDIVFGAGQYAPHSSDGLRVLAHELTHVVQQSGGVPSMGTLRIGPPADDFEREADAQAARVMAGGGVAVGMRGGAAGSLQRQQPPQQPPVSLPGAPCWTSVASRRFSRGNDDPLECQYQTALIETRLEIDPCSCTSPTSGTMPVRFNYTATLDGKSYSNAAGTILETQASEIGAGVPGNPRRPGMSLRETGGASSGTLIHTTGGRPGDPGDTLSQRLILTPRISCAGGSVGGTVAIGWPASATLPAYTAETIAWTLSASGSGPALASSFTLTESTPSDRIQTNTVDLTGGGTAYPAFPGTPRDPACSCNPVTGVHQGTACPPMYRSGAAGFGPTTAPKTGSGSGSGGGGGKK